MLVFFLFDGVIFVYFDALMDMTKMFRRDELRQFLLNDGHPETDVDHAIRDWQQQGRFSQVEGGWDMFTLTEAGRAVVESLRDSLA